MGLVEAIFMGVIVPLMAIAFCIILPIAIWEIIEEFLDKEGLI